MRDKLSLDSSVVHVMRDRRVLEPQELSLAVGTEPLQIAFTNNRTLSNYEKKFDADIQNMRKELFEQQQTILRLQSRTTKLEQTSGIAKELACIECRAVANRVLLLAAMGWKKIDDNGRGKEAAFRRLAASQKNVLDASPYARSFVQQALELNNQRNGHAHPTPWTTLQQQVVRTRQVFLTLKKVRQQVPFAAFIINHAEKLIPEEYQQDT